MWNYLGQYFIFLLEIVTVVVAVFLLVSGIIAAASRGKDRARGKLIVKSLNKNYKEIKNQIEDEVLSKAELKRRNRQEKEEKKKEKNTENEEIKQDKLEEKDDAPQKFSVLRRKHKKAKKRIFVINFEGDIQASAVNSLREEVTAVLQIAKKQDEVVVVLESGGGVVHGYGLGASQLQRIKQNNIPLTVCVDKVAASGGYMMACIADKLLAAPFAIVGSIGVIAQMPNFHRWLKKHDIDFEQMTAGDYKRTLTMFGENTDKARNKFKQEIEEAHELFKLFVGQHRPQVDIKTVSTGEYWYGTQAKERMLVDNLQTSDDYLLEIYRSNKADLFEIKYKIKKSLPAKLVHGLSKIVSSLASH